MSALLFLVPVLSVALTSAAPLSCPPLQQVVVLDAHRGGVICVDDARSNGFVVVDLSDSWVPLVLADSTYAATYVGLADERYDVVGAGPRASDDRYFEQWGIVPNLTVLEHRLQDSPRHACDALVDNSALHLGQGVRRASPAHAERSAQHDEIDALQGHMVCEGLLNAGDADGVFGPATARALAVWQRKEALYGEAGVVDDETRARLSVSSRRRDLQAVMRALRERVADAAGLIEDGSALDEQATVLGVLLDPPSMRPSRRQPALRGAPDLVDRSTDTAARALGFDDDDFGEGMVDVDHDAAVVALVHRARGFDQIAVRLPFPAWHSAHMADLAAGIDLGEVTSTGVGVRGGERPVLRLTTVIDGEIVPLVTWPTTIGGNQRVQLDSGDIVRRNKASPVGLFVWRWLWAAPVWYPPRSTPDDELVLRGATGVVVNDEGIGPGYRSAFGLMMFQHHNVLTRTDGSEQFVDNGVRTHGTGTVRSVLIGGASHGCHRLLPRSALRLATFVLRHRAHMTSVPVLEGYDRDLVVGGRHLRLVRTVRGTRTELTPPMVVNVAETCPING